MRKLIFTLLLMLLTVGQNALAADFSRLVLLHTNDTHGYALQEKGRFGMASLKAYKDSLTQAGYDVLLLDAGDCTQGNAFVNLNQGRAAVEYMNAVGYTAGCLGNHEFDYGQKVLKDNLAQLNFPELSCNVVYTNSGKLLVPASTIVERPSGKIGIIGMTTPTTKTSSMPSNTVGLSFWRDKALYKAVQQEINKLQAAHCDLIVAVGHMGSNPDCVGGRSDDVINNTKGLDIFVDGHDHRVKNNYINGVLQAETGYFDQNVGKITFDGTKWVEELVPAYDGVDAQVNQVLTKYEQQLEPLLKVPVAQTAQTLSGERAPGMRTQEMPLGDLVTDAYLWEARQEWQGPGKVDFAIANGGGIRANLPQGSLNRKHIYDCLAFNNGLYIATIQGKYLLEALEAATQTIPYPMGAYPQVSGIKYTLDTRVPYAKGRQYPDSMHYAPAKPGSRVQIESVGGAPFDPEKVYTFAISSFLVAGGDAYGAMKEHATPKQMLTYAEQEIFEKYLTQELHGVIPERYFSVAGRITQK